MSGETGEELRAYVRRLEEERAQLLERLENVDLWAEQTRAAAEAVRPLLRSMQESRFWRARNAWFDLKHRLGLHPVGAQPLVDLIVADYEPLIGKRTEYERWLRANGLRAADAELVRGMVGVLPRAPVISVLMPAYDTPERYLRAALDSVLAQLYPHWELCVADDASPDPRVREVLHEYAAREPRIKLALRETNGHIAAASNSALALATGEYVALLDHDDVLTPDALFHVALAALRDPDAGVIYSDEDKIDELGRRAEPYFKPDWSPDSFLARMYVGHLLALKRALVVELGGFRTGFEGSQDYDLVLRASERTERVHHIPRVLYHWRIHPQSTSSETGSKAYAYEAGRRAIEEAIARRGEPGRVEQLPEPGSYVVRYDIRAPLKVSVVMPTRDHGEDVERALSSIFANAAPYENFELLLIDNGSTDRASLDTFAAWAAREPRVRVVRYDVPFNFARINNFGAEQTDGAYLLFLNNDTEVLTPDWMEAMVEQAQRPSIGAVGAKLLYPDGTVQHAGVVTGIGGVAGHAHKHADPNDGGYFNTLRTVNNYSAVTGACMMVRREAFARAGGFDEKLAVAFNDVDLCLKLRALGLYNVYLAHVQLIHHESKSRGSDEDPAKAARFQAERRIMEERWRTAERADPHYSAHLTLVSEDFSLRA
ncbi:MAG TPA: glycosyltransferase family 2 protein [Candidatus Elarobacter sp.]|jgi:GT2 family glycosyltransferase|nr:glycosyltransferase family 2 protein [Candidatus Elarobacter sp.]